MKLWKSILLLALVFAAGIAVGVVGTRIAIRRLVQQAVVHPEKAQFALERSLTRRLRLDNDQQVRIHAILTDTRGQLGALRQEFQPQAAEVLRGADRKITALLTPAQQARYERIKDVGWPALRRLRPATP